MDWSLIFSNALYTAISINAIGYALIAQGLNVHFGYTGLLNFGQAGFAAAGAYAVAIPVSRYGWSFWATIPVVLIAAIVLALLLGIPTLRLRADYLAIVTIAAVGDRAHLAQLGALHVVDRRQRRPAEVHGRPASRVNPFSAAPVQPLRRRRSTSTTCSSSSAAGSWSPWRPRTSTT